MLLLYYKLFLHVSFTRCGTIFFFSWNLKSPLETHFSKIKIPIFFFFSRLFTVIYIYPSTCECVWYAVIFHKFLKRQINLTNDNLKTKLIHDSGIATGLEYRIAKSLSLSIHPRGQERVVSKVRVSSIRLYKFNSLSAFFA